MFWSIAIKCIEKFGCREFLTCMVWYGVNLPFEFHICWLGCKKKCQNPSFFLHFWISLNVFKDCVPTNAASTASGVSCGHKAKIAELSGEIFWRNILVSYFLLNFLKLLLFNYESRQPFESFTWENIKGCDLQNGLPRTSLCFLVLPLTNKSLTRRIDA